jgi:hypothetical protein
MAITMIPDEGSTIKNFQIYESGSVFDSTAKTIKQGSFLSGKLSGANCTTVNYSLPLITIRRGDFTAGKEDGAILEYVFDQANWDALFSDVGISVTRYTHIFSSGVWQLTSATETKVIKGTRTVNAKSILVAFSFSEV